MGHSPRTTPVVIGLAGYKGSGKTTIATALATHLHATIASFGAYVRQHTSTHDALSLANRGAELLATQGPATFLRESIAAANWDGTAPLIIEGIRHTRILDAARAQFPHLYLVFITTPPADRHQRLQERDHLPAQTIAQLAAHSTEAELAVLEGRADQAVDGTLDADSIAIHIMDALE